MTKENNRRRLVQLHISQGQTAQEALAVARADREGFVDGVLVDFRHPDIPSGEWEARAFWYAGCASTSHSGFLFPSEAAYLDEHPERKDMIDWDKNDIPLALAGDRLTVERVVDRIADRKFDHLHDSTIKEAHLILTRSNGEVVRPSSPMCFYGATQFRDGPTRDAYDRLAERILQEHGWPDAERFETENRLRPLGEWRPSTEFPLTDRAALAIARAERSWHQLKDLLGDDGRKQALLRAVMNETALAAFYQAKHELRKAEETATKVASGGCVRKARAKDKRLEYARGIWEVDPALKISTLATQVLEQLIMRDGIEPVTTTAITQSLKAAVGRGDLVIPPQSPDHPDFKG